MLTVYHNPRCSKSRQALAYLEQQKLPHQIRPYLEQPLSLQELTALFAGTGLRDVRDMMRHNDELFIQLGFAEPNVTPQQLLVAIERTPILLQRPIVANEHGACIARSTELLSSWLTQQGYACDNT
jgi:arsenate reductase